MSKEAEPGGEMVSDASDRLRRLTILWGRMNMLLVAVIATTLLFVLLRDQPEQALQAGERAMPDLTRPRMDDFWVVRVTVMLTLMTATYVIAWKVMNAHEVGAANRLAFVLVTLIAMVTPINSLLPCLVLSWDVRRRLVREGVTRRWVRATAEEIFRITGTPHRSPSPPPLP
jgi:hypothetical protein